MMIQYLTVEETAFTMDNVPEIIVQTYRQLHKIFKKNNIVDSIAFLKAPNKRCSKYIYDVHTAISLVCIIICIDVLILLSMSKTRYLIVFYYMAL